MSDQTAVETDVDFEVVDRPDVPKRSFSRASKWRKVIEAAMANEGKFVLVKPMKQTVKTESGTEEKTRPERSIMAALTGFAKRHAGLLQGRKLHTQTHIVEGKPAGVLVWAAQPADQTELPLNKSAAA